jgi:hypothetical protein
MVLWELTGKLVFIMDSRFHGNVIPAKAGTHLTQDSFPRNIPKSQKNKPSMDKNATKLD